MTQREGTMARDAIVRCSMSEIKGMWHLGKQQNEVVQPLLACWASTAGQLCKGDDTCHWPSLPHTGHARLVPGARWQGDGLDSAISALRLLRTTPFSSLGNVQHTVILNSTVLKCPCNGYNNHLTNNLEQALIASNVVLRLGYGESREALVVTALLWLYDTSGSICTEEKATSLLFFLPFGEPGSEEASPHPSSKRKRILGQQRNPNLLVLCDPERISWGTDRSREMYSHFS